MERVQREEERDEGARPSGPGRAIQKREQQYRRQGVEQYAGQVMQSGSRPEKLPIQNV